MVSLQFKRMIHNTLIIIFAHEHFGSLYVFFFFVFFFNNTDKTLFGFFVQIFAQNIRYASSTMTFIFLAAFAKPHRRNQNIVEFAYTCTHERNMRYYEIIITCYLIFTQSETNHRTLQLKNGIDYFLNYIFKYTTTINIIDSIRSFSYFPGYYITFISLVSLM